MEQVRADQFSLVSLEEDLKELGKANLLSEIKDLKASLGTGWSYCLNLRRFTI